MALRNDLYPQATGLAAGENMPIAFGDLSANSGDMLLFSFVVKGQQVCSELTITIDFSGTDTTMKYYAPVQWSRIYMPVVCDGSFQGVKITVNTGAILVAETVAENKKNASIESLSLQSGMWMLDSFEDIAVDAYDGVKSRNEDVYAQLGVSISQCIDLVISSCGNYIYSIGGGYLTVTDVSDPANPRVRSIFNNPDYPSDYGDTRQIDLIPGGGANGDAVIFSGRISGVFIVDVSDPAHPVELSHYDAQEMATGIAYYEGYAFIANRQYGVEIVDVTDPCNPVHLGVVSRGGEVQSCKVVDGILYCGLYNTNQVEMYDVTDLFAPKLLGRADLNGRGDGMTVATEIGRAHV